MTRTAYLIQRLLKDELTPEESRELEAWRLADPANQEFLERFESPLVDQNLARMNSIDWHTGYDKFVQKHPEYRTPLPTNINRSFHWFRWAAAAAILLSLSLLTWLTLQRRSDQPVAVQGSQQQRYAQDVQPGGNKAILTIGNNQPILLDTLQSALRSGSTLLSNQDGLLQYQSNHSDKDISINTVTTPNGGTYRVILPDGTRVWLNAASSISFPSAFNGKERLVTTEGELYFEVAKDPARPFIVQSKHTRTEVLGTDLNVSDYDNDPQTRTTLLAGSVAVNNAGNRVLLQPGTEAIISRSGKIDTKPADIESTIAWKNGYFIFNGVPLQMIMRQLERWYDVKVIQEAAIPENFVAAINRDEPLSKVLKLLELTGEVKFSIDKKTIRVFK
ncbi:MAG: FecR domain-containing protein [Chitinophagaceae bacterium]|nr:FecR domain-containing protein [Chitinophagaceae bacterium]